MIFCIKKFSAWNTLGKVFQAELFFLKLAHYLEFLCGEHFCKIVPKGALYQKCSLNPFLLYFNRDLLHRCPMLTSCTQASLPQHATNKKNDQSQQKALPLFLPLPLGNAQPTDKKLNPRMASNLNAMSTSNPKATITSKVTLPNKKAPCCHCYHHKKISFHRHCNALPSLPPKNLLCHNDDGVDYAELRFTSVV